MSLSFGIHYIKLEIKYKLNLVDFIFLKMLGVRGAIFNGVEIINKWESHVFYSCIILDCKQSNQWLHGHFTLKLFLLVLSKVKSARHQHSKVNCLRKGFSHGQLKIGTKTNFPKDKSQILIPKYAILWFSRNSLKQLLEKV